LSGKDLRALARACNGGCLSGQELQQPLRFSSNRPSAHKTA
jgi:hypothetical protein